MENSKKIFVENGPFRHGNALLKKKNGKFHISDHADALYRDTAAGASLKKIADAFNRKDFAEAAIRYSHFGFEYNYGIVKSGFDPQQPRNNRGEWSPSDQARGGTGESKNSQTSVSVGYCKMVKELCIVEATDKLPTSDYGAIFFKAYNACMDRHDCLGVA